MNIKLVKQWLRYYPHQYDKQLKSKNTSFGFLIINWLKPKTMTSIFTQDLFS